MSDNLYSPLPTLKATGDVPWEMSEVISEAWEKFKNNAAVLIVASLVIFFASFIINFVVQLPINILTTAVQVAAEENEALVAVVVVVGSLLGASIQMVVNTIAMIGMTRLHLAVARGQTADLGMLTSGYGRFLTVLGTQLLVGLAVFAGILFFFVPGMILAMGLAMAQIYAIDSELGPMDCIRRSWEVMDDNKLRFFGTLFVLGFAAAFAVILTCGLGLLVVWPMMGLVTAIIFTRITGRTGAPALLG